MELQCNLPLMWRLFQDWGLQLTWFVQIKSVKRNQKKVCPHSWSVTLWCVPLCFAVVINVMNCYFQEGGYGHERLINWWTACLVLNVVLNTSVKKVFPPNCILRENWTNSGVSLYLYVLCTASAGVHETCLNQPAITGFIAQLCVNLSLPSSACRPVKLDAAVTWVCARPQRLTYTRVALKHVVTEEWKVRPVMIHGLSEWFGCSGDM